jgi:hypothetical protein
MISLESTLLQMASFPVNVVTEKLFFHDFPSNTHQEFDINVFKENWLDGFECLLLYWFNKGLESNDIVIEYDKYGPGYSYYKNYIGLDFYKAELEITHSEGSENWIHCIHDFETLCSLHKTYAQSILHHVPDMPIFATDKHK